MIAAIWVAGAIGYLLIGTVVGGITKAVQRAYFSPLYVTEWHVIGSLLWPLVAVAAVVYGPALLIRAFITSDALKGIKQ